MASAIEQQQVILQPPRPRKPSNRRVRGYYVGVAVVALCMLVLMQTNKRNYHGLVRYAYMGFDTIYCNLFCKVPHHEWVRFGVLLALAVMHLAADGFFQPLYHLCGRNAFGFAFIIVAGRFVFGPFFKITYRIVLLIAALAVFGAIMPPGEGGNK